MVLIERVPLFILAFSVFFSNITVSSIAAGYSHSLALTTDGKVYAWGGNFTGQLGLGTIGFGTEEYYPTLITALSNITVSSIAGGNYHSLALTTDGKVYAWGLGNIDEKNPTLITALSNITVSSIVIGDSHSFALTTDGKVYAWGLNNKGQLGLGTSSYTNSPTLITAILVDYTTTTYTNDNTATSSDNGETWVKQSYTQTTRSTIQQVTTVKDVLWTGQKWIVVGDIT